MTESAPSTGDPRGATPLQQQQPTEDLTPGSISGKLSYPSEAIPPLRLVADHVDTGEYVSIEVPMNTTDTKLDDVPSGKYRMVAYLLNSSSGQPSISGGYSQMVPCGLQASCVDHSLIILEVRPGEVTANIGPGDWYASPGTFSPDPTRK